VRNQFLWHWLPRLLPLACALVVWNVALVCIPPVPLLGVLLAVALLVGIFLLVRGARRFAAADLLAGLVSAAAAVGFVSAVLHNSEEVLPVVTHADVATAAPDRLRVIDFNVLHGFPDFENQETRFQDTVAAFRALKPDLVILQEAWNTTSHGNMAERLADALRMHYVYARANGSRRLIGFEEGSAVLSRFPIRDARRLLLEPHAPLWERRIALVTTIDLGGKPLTVVGVHCHDANEDIAADQAHSLLVRLPKSGPVLVAGDFNAGSQSRAVAHFTGAGYTEALPRGELDHLLLPPRDWDWQLAAAQWTFTPNDLLCLIGRRAEISDHPAIVADFIRRP
jgi:endonuclease/exonuclease/phosphatase family metal-dependent hydrolase